MEGKTVAIDGFRLGAPMEIPPPIYVGAQGRIDAADGRGNRRRRYRQLHHARDVSADARTYSRGCAQGRQANRHNRIACRIVVAIDQEEEIVREQLRRELTAYLTVPQYNKFFQWIGYEKEARTAITAWNAGDRKKALAVDPGPDDGIDLYLRHARSLGEAAEGLRKGGNHLTALQFTSYVKDPEEKRKRIMRAMEALSSAW